MARWTKGGNHISGTKRNDRRLGQRRPRLHRYSGNRLRLANPNDLGYVPNTQLLDNWGATPTYSDMALGMHHHHRLLSKRAKDQSRLQYAVTGPRPLATASEDSGRLAGDRLRVKRTYIHSIWPSFR